MRHRRQSSGQFRVIDNTCPVCGTRLKPGQMHSSESRGTPAHVSFDVNQEKWIMVAEGGAYGTQS